MRSFEDALNAHKSELAEALLIFSEHKRVNKVLAEVEMQRPDFYKFYKEGQESRQNEVDELQKRVDEYSQIGIGLIQELRDARQDPQSLKGASDRQFYESLERLEQALKGGCDASN